MAGIKPAFITGANAKIKVANKTFAYASDVSYQIVVDTIPIETMGRYEAVTNEPVNYSVAGELSIVRYTKQTATIGIPNTATNGNGLGAVTNASSVGKVSDQFDPSQMLASETFDLEVFQKLAGGAISDAVIKIMNCRFTRKSAGLNKRGILIDRLSFVGILGQDDSFSVGGSGEQDLA